MLKELKDVYIVSAKPSAPMQGGLYESIAVPAHLAKGTKYFTSLPGDAPIYGDDSVPLRLTFLTNGRQIFKYQGRFYEADRDLTADDVDALVNEAANRKRLKLQKAHALKAMTEQMDGKAKRQPIPQDVKMLVWQRDRGRCVECGSSAALEYDHIIPLAMGGSNTDRNLQLLCEACNRRKGATLG